MFDDLDANNLKVRDLLAFIGTPIILIGGGILIGSVSKILFNSVAFILVGIILLICGIIIVKRKITGDVNYVQTDTSTGNSSGAIDLLYYLLFLFTPLMKNKSGKSAKLIGYLFILVGFILTSGAIWYGLPELLRILYT